MSGETQGFCSSQPVAVHIKVVDQSYFAIPNAFTPNGDGRNDVLHVPAIGYIMPTDFKIYNQWGQLMFETNRLNDGWNGTFDGVLCSKIDDIGLLCAAPKYLPQCQTGL